MTAGIQAMKSRFMDLKKEDKKWRTIITCSRKDIILRLYRNINRRCRRYSRIHLSRLNLKITV